MRISPQGLDFIKGFEGFVPYVYDDLRPPVKGVYREWKGETVRGTLTIGYGHTNAAKHPLRIKLGLRVSEQEALEILDVDLDECEEDVNRLVKVSLTQGQYDACVSLLFNIGVGNFQKSSILRKLNKGDYRGARAAFDLYVKSKGKTLRGLQRRRDGEQALWDSDIPETPTEPQGVDHPAEVEKEAEPIALGPVATTVAAGGTAAAVEVAQQTVPPPPPSVTETITNIGLWKGMGETVKAFGVFAWSEPYLVGGIVSVMVLLIFGPRLAKKWGWA